MLNGSLDNDSCTMYSLNPNDFSVLCLPSLVKKILHSYFQNESQVLFFWIYNLFFLIPCNPHSENFFEKHTQTQNNNIKLELEMMWPSTFYFTILEPTYSSYFGSAETELQPCCQDDSE